MKVFIKGLNTCTQRAPKLQQYHDFLVANGHQVVDGPEGSDAIVVWTCAFRGDVRDNSIDQLKSLAGHGAKVVATGCLPDIDPEVLAASFGGEVVNWKEDEAKLERLFRAGGPGLAEAESVFAEPALCGDLVQHRRAHPDSDVTFPDQFIKLVVAEGCPFKCTYCSERLAFPRYRSVPEDRLVEACRRIVAETGQTDVILLADCVGEYGRDTGGSLPRLIRHLCAIHPRLRVALSNMQPFNFLQHFDEFRELLLAGRIRHLNLPIQTASNRLLSLMKRVYEKADLERMFGLFREIGFDQFDTHVLVGFPGETEADIEETVEFLLRHKVRYVLISKYMETASMPSSALAEKVPPEVASRRVRDLAARLQAAGVICNTEGSDLMEERMERLNKGNKFKRAGLMASTCT